jgi:DNA-binding NarL/FixJ family response regulator
MHSQAGITKARHVQPSQGLELLYAYDLAKEVRPMEIQEALKIMRALAGGVNPQTGEVLETDSICRIPQNVKALNRALSALVIAEERERNKPAKAWKYWTREEEAQICEELRKGTDFQQIAKTHNRSVGSIIARLVKLGKIRPQSPKVA